MIKRRDFEGVTSVIRDLELNPALYESLMNSFRSKACKDDQLEKEWWSWLLGAASLYRIGGRIIMLGDDTNTPKDGRKMAGMRIIHQHSETASKPQFFRGHVWSCLAVLTGIAPSATALSIQLCEPSKTATKKVQRGKKKSKARASKGRILKGLNVATSGKAEVSEDAPPVADENRIVWMVNQAIAFAMMAGGNSLLVVDAWFNTKTLYREAAKSNGKLEVLSRAKGNCVAYFPAERPEPGRKGRPAVYGKKVKVADLFKTHASQFIETELNIYGTLEKVRILAVNLMWRPVGKQIRFILCESSRGKIVLMSSDLQLPGADALSAYCQRVKIERLFDTGKNDFGCTDYHFWTKHLTPASRKPSKDTPKEASRTSKPESVKAAAQACRRYMTFCLMIVGVLQIVSDQYPSEVIKYAARWLRTPTVGTPSESVTKYAISRRFEELLAFPIFSRVVEKIKNNKQGLAS